PESASTDGNFIRTNGTFGVDLSSGTIDTTVSGNTIEANGDDGVLIKDSASMRNRISRNIISANGGLGISLSGGRNDGMAAPTIASGPGATLVAGMTPPGATVEVYRDPNGQGSFYKGSAVANGAGEWSLALPGDDDPSQGLPTAVAIAANGDTSAFGGNV